MPRACVRKPVERCSDLDGRSERVTAATAQTRENCVLSALGASTATVAAIMLARFFCD